MNLRSGGPGIGVARLADPCFDGLRGPKTMSKESNIVTVEVTFSCPTGHNIKRQFTHDQHPGGHRLIEDQRFDGLHCEVCGWTGDKLGKEANDVRIVSPPRP